VEEVRNTILQTDEYPLFYDAHVKSQRCEMEIITKLPL